MTDDLVARLLAAIQELARMQALSGEWVSVFNAGSGDHSVQTRTGSTVVQEDGLFEVGPHVALNDPAAVLRMCQAHRKIIDRYRNAKDAYQQARHRFNHNTEIQVMATLGAVLRDLAEGYGIESSAGIRNREDR